MEPLLQWFAKNRRDLPWRKEPRDPYRVWLSEVMLQQTRVDVVVPYFERFLRRFPTLQALAKAPIGEVLALWSGLGYYARARNLHKAAKAAAALGGLPRTSAELAELPGFGRYTSAAVASLAFGEQVALVDGNVARVLARVLRLPGDANEARAAAWEAAERLLPAGRAGEFNEALMELGATVCTPRSPRCDGCPIQSICKSFPLGDAENFPAPKAKRARPKLRWAALHLHRRDGALLLAQRPAEGLFGGLWELPTAESREQALQNHGLSNLQIDELQRLGSVRQILTHREITVQLWSARASGRAPAALRWCKPAELPSLGVSSLAAKALRACGVRFP